MLTELKVRQARAADRPYKLGDAGGLYLYVSPTGFKSWRHKFRVDRKEKRLVYGPYPEVSLKKAREARDNTRHLLRLGLDPTTVRKETEQLETFETTARTWHGKQSRLWSAAHSEKVSYSLERDILPVLGHMPIDQITPAEILDLVSKIEERGAIETAHRVLGRIETIFDYAIGAMLVSSNPASRRNKSLTPIRKRKQPALIKIEECRAFLSLVEHAPSHPLTRLASRLLALTAARPGMIRFAAPDEFKGLDTNEPDWIVPAEKMKLLQAEKDQEVFDFTMPLSRQAAEIVRLVMEIVGPGPYLFPSVRRANRPMSENAIGYAYNRIAEFRQRHVPHGWRSSFSTIMNELALANDRPGDAAVIELMLAHKPKGVAAIYNRAAYMPRRREIAQEWADHLLRDADPAIMLMDGPRR